MKTDKICWKYPHCFADSFGNVWQFLTILAIPDNFSNFWGFWQFWQFLTLLTFFYSSTLMTILTFLLFCQYWLISTISDKDQNKDINKKNPRGLWHLRHWLLFWQLGTWIHDNLCDLTFKSDIRYSCDVFSITRRSGSDVPLIVSDWLTDWLWLTDWVTDWQ